MKKNRLNIIRWALPFLFVFYTAGITLFIHSHVVNGVTIVHSHPFKKGSTHGHTTVQFQLIHILNQALNTGAGFSLFSLAFIATFLHILLWRPQIVRNAISYRSVRYLRGPPSFSF